MTEHLVSSPDEQGLKPEDVELEPVVMPAAEEPPPPPEEPPPPAEDLLAEEFHSAKVVRRPVEPMTGDKGKPCPQCGSERHKKRPITCPFKLWTDDFPAVPRHDKEAIRDAHRRVWELVKHNFLENDQYVKRDGWTYMGPPGGGSPAPQTYVGSPIKPSVERTTIRETPTRDSEEEDLSKNTKPCPECGVERHKKKPITCAFKLWTEDFPVVPKHDREVMRDAQQRIWDSVRAHFVENGQYVRREGYTFQGPPGMDIPGLGSFDLGMLDPPRAKPRKPTSPSKSPGGMITTTTSSPDNDENKAGKVCPECGLERHKKKPTTCPFKQWTMDYPVVPRLPGERTRDAHHRIWPTVRDEFIENDQYVKREGWNNFSVDMGELNAPEASKTKKRVKDSDSGSVTKRSKGNGEDKLAKRCPECGAERHRKKPSNCAFKQWTDDYPNVPRLGREHIRDAQRRIWNHVKKLFMDSEDKYVKREGWTYTGVGSGAASRHMPVSPSADLES